jgi:structure-specific endonuclease subunit SLX1
MKYSLYILVHDKHNKTYCGITNNLTRRLRQHNNELKGGARYTTNNLSDGKWSYYALVHGLTKSEALSIEWKMHHGKKCSGKTPIERRINKLNELGVDYEFCNNN